MNKIISRQNEDEFIELLKAQRVAYSKAKKYQILELMDALVALFFPIIAL